MTRAMILSGPERRRSWPNGLRAEILAEAFRPGAVVSEVARRYDVSTSRIYTWRKELMEAGLAPNFVEAIVTPSSPIVDDVATVSGIGISVDMPCGARVRISSGASAELVTATLRALR
jgi:transposase